MKEVQYAVAKRINPLGHCMQIVTACNNWGFEDGAHWRLGIIIA